jgi:hypothetical protein
MFHPRAQGLIMKPTTKTVLRWITLLAVAATTGACNLTLSAGSSGSPQFLILTATSDSRPADTQQQPPPDSEPAATFTPTLEITPTLEFTPTHTPTATEALPTMTAGQELSCVKGPHWILFEWVAKISEGETVTLLAKASEDWEEYYYVRKSNGAECWVFGGSSTKTGDYYSLPVREAPPLPEVTYTIENATGLNVCDVHIREKDSTDWGADRLGTGWIAPGASHSLTFTAGFYDVRIKDCVCAVLYEEHDRAIGSDAGYRYTLLNNTVDFSIKNDFAFNVCRYDFRIAGGSWETLHSPADGTIANGQYADFTLLVGYYDIQVYRCTGPSAGTFPGRYIGPMTTTFTLP